jgi:hypothetical protein
VAAFYGQDGRYAGNAGAISGACVNILHPEKRNAGAISGISGEFPGSAAAQLGPESPGSRVAARRISAIVNPISRCMRNSLLMLKVEVLNFGAAESGNTT